MSNLDEDIGQNLASQSVYPNAQKPFESRKFYLEADYLISDNGEKSYENVQISFQNGFGHVLF